MRSHHSSGLAAIKTPPITSLCPPKYLVEECITISTPQAIGCWQIGVAKVLSHPTLIPCCWAMATTVLISVTFNNGLDGDSIQINPVLGLICDLICPTSVISIKSNSSIQTKISFN